MRIVGGDLRGRRLVPPRDISVRPTTDRVREALFNLLMHGPFAPPGGLTGTVVLDGFCGTGGLGLEALSRGADHAWFVDADPASLALARRNAEALGVLARCGFQRGAWPRLRPKGGPFGLVFLDPPYGTGLAAPVLGGLLAGGMLAPGAICVTEDAATADATPPDGFRPVTERVYGHSLVRLLEVRP